MSIPPTCPTCHKPLKANPFIGGFSCADCGLDFGFTPEEMKANLDAIPKSIDQLAEICEKKGVFGSVKVDILLYKKLVDDSKLLDFLDAQGGKWVARDSFTGRGYRVHQSESLGTHPTARAAIKEAMQFKSKPHELSH